jgi:hypothetical protein
MKVKDLHKLTGELPQDLEVFINVTPPESGTNIFKSADRVEIIKANGDEFASIETNFFSKPPQDITLTLHETNIILTPLQKLFFDMALGVKNEVLPLSPLQLSPETFEEDYGFSQEQMNDELEKLKQKLNL